MTDGNRYAPGPGALPIFVRLVTGSIQQYQSTNAAKMALILEEIQLFFNSDTVVLHQVNSTPGSSVELAMIAQVGLTPAQKTAVEIVTTAALRISATAQSHSSWNANNFPLFAPGGAETTLSGNLSIGNRRTGEAWTKEEIEAFQEIASALAICLARYRPDMRS